MFSFFYKIVRAVKVSLLLENVWDFVAKGEIGRAESLFITIKKELKELCAEHQIMEAYIKFKASKYEEAVKLFDLAWKKVEEDSDLDSNEKLYFKAYILKPALVSLDFLRLTNPEMDYVHIEIFDLNLIDLSKVKDKWKLHFPLK